MTPPITLRLPYPVSSNRYWATRVVTPKGRKPFATTYVTPEAEAYKADVALLATAAGLRVPLEGRVAMRIDLFPERPQDWVKRAQADPDYWDDDVRCIDLGNCEKVLADALQGIAYVNDKQLRRIYLERQEPDQFGARCIVTIGRLHQVLIARDLFAA